MAFCRGGVRQERAMNGDLDEGLINYSKFLVIIRIVCRAVRPAAKLIQPELSVGVFTYRHVACHAAIGFTLLVY
jgi:hypothetical protein